MNPENQGNPIPLRSVIAGKYVRYLTHEDISGDPIHCPLSNLMKKQVYSIGNGLRREVSVNEFDRAITGGRSLELMYSCHVSKLN